MILGISLQQEVFFMTVRKAYESRLLDQGKVLNLDQIQARVRDPLNSLIEKNKYRVKSKLENAPFGVTERQIGEIFEESQKDIHQWIAKMAAEVPIVQPVDISWTEGNIRLQVLYSHLRDKPESKLVFELCDNLRVLAKARIREKSRSASAEKIRELETKEFLRARELIGMAVFAGERNPQRLIKDLADEGATVADHLRFFVKSKLDKVCNRLTNKNQAYNDYYSKDSYTVYSIEAPKQIAELLLTVHGQINWGMIGAIKGQFFPESAKLSEYGQGIVFVLDRMDESWQEAIDAVEIPLSPEAASNAMIRADLGMLPGEEITKLHCQQAVLGALLSQMSHRSAGNSLAIAWAKKDDAFLLNCLADYTALVRDSHLTRTVSGSPEQFFFKNTLADEWISSQITLNSNGTISEYDDVPFWECPNLIAACRQMGITDLKSGKDALLRWLFGSESEAKDLSWDALIWTCAEFAAGSDENQDALFSAGRYGFSVSGNRLLSAWETSLAAMSEARPGDYVRDNVNRCVLKALQPIFANQENTASLYQKTLIKEVEAVFQKIVNNSFRLVYNDAIPHFSPGNSYLAGGYELYQKDASDLTNKGVRIATPDEFRALVLGALDQTKAAEYARVTSKEDRRVIDSILQALHLCASGANFMKNVLYLYDDANKEERDPVAHYQNLHRTPMTSLNGDNPWEAMAPDTGMDFTPDIKTIRPNDAEDLLKWLLGLAKWKEATEYDLADAVSRFIIDGREFKRFLSSGLSADIWIKKTLVDPGMQISRAEMDDGSKLIFSQKVQGWLSDQYDGTIPENSVREMEILFSTLHSRVITVQQFAQRSQDGLFHIFNLRPEQASALDALLLQSLPAAQLRAIQQRTVPFALRELNMDSEDVYICCFFNPRTEKVDYGSIAENKTGLQPMDQFEWLEKMVVKILT